MTKEDFVILVHDSLMANNKSVSAINAGLWIINNRHIWSPILHPIADDADKLNEIKDYINSKVSNIRNEEQLTEWLIDNRSTLENDPLMEY